MSTLLVLGNAGFDLGSAVPHLPRAGETLVAGRTDRAPGGKGLNQAVVAARAGAATVLVAPVGSDAAGAELVRVLGDEALARFDAIVQTTATDQSILMVAPDGENCILSFGPAADAFSPDAAAAAVAGLGPGDMLLMQGNFGLETTRAAMTAARGRGARVMFNPAPLRWDCAGLLSLCDVLVANAGEAEGITGRGGPEAASALYAEGVGIAVVTLGASGAVVADREGERRFAAAPADVVDTTGAGDTVCGVLAAGLLAGETVDAAMRAALRAAALTVSRPGAFAALPRAEEVRGRA